MALRRRCASYREQDFLQLIAFIYDAATDPQQWPKFLGRYNELLKGETAALHFDDPDHRVGYVEHAVHFDPYYAEVYQKYYCRLNIYFLKGMDIIQSGRFVPGSSIVPRSQFERSEYYNDFLRPQNWYHAMGGAVVQRASANSMLAIFRQQASPDFGEEEVLFTERLLVHLRRALELHQRISVLEADRLSFTSVLDRLREGVILIDKNGSVLLLNAAAQEIIARNDALSVHRAGLQAANLQQNAELSRMIHGTAKTSSANGTSSGGYLAVTRNSRSRPYLLLVTPLPAHRHFVGVNSAAVAVFITDPEKKPEANEEILKHLYGLTPKQTNLVSHLLEGKSLQETASEMQVSSETVRSHLKEIFSKTGTTRQAELLALLLKSTNPIEPM